LVGFVHIHFSLQGEVVDVVEGEPSLFVDEIQLLPAFRRQGIGKYTMTLIELIARKHKMASMTVPLVKGNPVAEDFFRKALRGFSLDAKYGEDEEQMILSKFFGPSLVAAAVHVPGASLQVASAATSTDSSTGPTPSPLTATHDGSKKSMEEPHGTEVVTLTAASDSTTTASIPAVRPNSAGKKNQTKGLHTQPTSPDKAPSEAGVVVVHEATSPSNAETSHMQTITTKAKAAPKAKAPKPKS